MHLRALLATAPVLSRPSNEREFTLQVDASNCGLGCVLTQDIDGKEYVIRESLFESSRAKLLGYGA